MVKSELLPREQLKACTARTFTPGTRKDWMSEMVLVHQGIGSGKAGLAVPL